MWYWLCDSQCCNHTRIQYPTYYIRDVDPHLHLHFINSSLSGILCVLYLRMFSLILTLSLSLSLSFILALNVLYISILAYIARPHLVIYTHDFGPPSLAWRVDPRSFPPIRTVHMPFPRSSLLSPGLFCRVRCHGSDMLQLLVHSCVPASCLKTLLYS